MSVDAALVPRLNLLHDNPSFVLGEDDKLENAVSVPASAGLVMLAGVTILPRRSRVSSVFEIDADGGELFRVYWLIDGEWHDSSDPAGRRTLAPTDAEIFPFDWETAIPLEVDHYHGDPPPRRRPLP